MRSIREEVKRERIGENDPGLAGRNTKMLSQSSEKIIKWDKNKPERV